ncbi:MAG: glycoside hydrolase, partial [Gramella sp.]|nr:glycoside hydrolase [Christiangramia sp.]
LFTEYGYRSIDHALREPWNSQNNLTGINQELQARALKVVYEEFWDENWFAGGFLWKWHQYEHSGGANDNMFTPQNKPAEEVIQRYYHNFRN